VKITKSYLKQLIREALEEAGYQYFKDFEEVPQVDRDPSSWRKKLSPEEEELFNPPDEEDLFADMDVVNAPGLSDEEIEKIEQEYSNQKPTKSNEPSLYPGEDSFDLGQRNWRDLAIVELEKTAADYDKETDPKKRKEMYAKMIGLARRVGGRKNPQGRQVPLDDKYKNYTLGFKSGSPSNKKMNEWIKGKFPRKMEESLIREIIKKKNLKP